MKGTEIIEWRTLDNNNMHIGHKGKRRFYLKKSPFGSMGLGRALTLKTKNQKDSEWKNTDILFLISGDSNGALKKSYKRKLWTLDGTEYSEIDLTKIKKEVEEIAEVMF